MIEFISSPHSINTKTSNFNQSNSEPPTDIFKVLISNSGNPFQILRITAHEFGVFQGTVGTHRCEDASISKEVIKGIIKPKDEQRNLRSPQKSSK